MKYAFICDHCSEYPLRLCFRILGVSSSGYYDWLRRGPSNREQGYEELDLRILQAHKKGRGTYGVERVQEELAKNGYNHGDKLIRKRLRNMGIHFERRRKFVTTTDSNHNLPCAENLLNRDFRAPGPGMVYVGDITYVPGSNGWLYVATAIDLYSRKIAGWAISDRMDTSLVNKALIQAREGQDKSSSFIFHSDRGSQYASREYRQLLFRLGGVQSMSRRGDCWDNAVAESFNSALKREWLYRRKGAKGTLKELELELFDYIECFYNRTRIHSTLGFCSPVEFEENYFTKNRVA